MGTCSSLIHEVRFPSKLCDAHPKERLCYFCEDCKKLLCAVCSRTTHNGHNWGDANPEPITEERREEIINECQIIRERRLPIYKMKLREFDIQNRTVERREFYNKFCNLVKMALYLDKNIKHVQTMTCLSCDRRSLRLNLTSSKLQQLMKEDHSKCLTMTISYVPLCHYQTRVYASVLTVKLTLFF